MRRLDTGNKQFDSSRLCYFSKDRINGIDLEFHSTQEQLRCYLVVHSTPIPAKKENPNFSQATVQTKDQNTPFLIHRLKGGQKLLLTQQAQELLLSLLIADEPLLIKLEGYQEQIQPGSFKRYLAKLDSPSLLERLKQRVTIENLSF